MRELTLKMTYENCMKYLEEAKAIKNDDLAKFWEERVRRKYPEKFIEEVKEEEPKKKRGKKE